MSKGLVCWNCGNSIADIPLPISRHANCASCFEMQHNCRMCQFYNTGSIDDCEEDRADPPVIKEGANFCEYFKPAPGRFEHDTLRKQTSAMSNLDALFGEDESAVHVDSGKAAGADSDNNESARSRLDDLFGD